ncbi:hypothetical protein PI27_gp034 [Listeria phage WIL-1]|nr:hypothetical protein PI27_gp034 [Listeria phage WIL-1]
MVSNYVKKMYEKKTLPVHMATDLGIS